MDKETLMSFVDSASPKNLRDFAGHVVDLLTETQMKSLEPMFSARISFIPKTEQAEEKVVTEPQNVPESNPDKELDEEVENLL